MKKVFLALIIVFSIVSLVCCSQQSVSEITLKVICGSSASKAVTISADADADAYVLVGGAYVSVTANPYQGKYGILEVKRNNSDWKVYYIGGVTEGKETITIVIGIGSGAVLSKQFGSIVATCEVTAQPTPEEDQVKVTTSCETLVVGSPASDNEYQIAVSKRLKNKVSKYNNETTEAMVIYPNAFGSLTEEQQANIVHCFEKSGDVVFVNPDKETFVTKIIPQLMDKTYGAEVLRYKTEGLSRADWLKYRGRHLWNVSASEVLLAEQGKIVSIGFHRGNRYTYQSKGGDMSNLTGYEAGIMADGLASWMNTTTAEKTKGSSELQELSEADIQTKEYEGWQYIAWNGNIYANDGYDNAIQEIITVYSMYSESDNRDWYEVDQQITFRNANFEAVPASGGYPIYTDWWSGYIKNWNKLAWYITPENYWENNLSLSMPGGSIVLYESHPDTENGSQSSSYSTTEGTSTGVTDGGSVGLSLGFTTLGLSGNFSASYSHSVNTTESASVTTGSSMSINDLSVTKTTDGSKVKWKYKFREPYGYFDVNDVWMWWAPPLALTDCTQQNSTLYYVDNPSGPATINSDTTYCPYFYWEDSSTWWADYYFEDVDPFTINNSFTLPEPKRYIEDWSISCVDYGDITGNYLAIEAFEASITRDIIGADNRINEVGGADKYDTTCANLLLDQFMNEFESFSESYAARGFTGTFKFKLQSVADSSKYIKKEFTIAKPE